MKISFCKINYLFCNAKCSFAKLFLFSIGTVAFVKQTCFYNAKCDFAKETIVFAMQSVVFAKHVLLFTKLLHFFRSHTI